MVEVKLVEHIGHMGTPLGVSEVKFDQKIVFARNESDKGSWVQVGYIGNKPGSHLQGVIALPQHMWQAIAKEIEKKLKWLPAISAFSGVQAEAAREDHEVDTEVVEE